MGGARGGRRTALEQGVLYTTLGKSDGEMATLLGMRMTLSRGVHDTSSDCCSGVSVEVDSEKGGRSQGQSRAKLGLGQVEALEHVVWPEQALQLCGQEALRACSRNRDCPW